MKIILVNILLVSAALGFTVERNHIDLSTNNPAVETVSNISDALNRDTKADVSFDEMEITATGFNYEYPLIYGKPKIENNKSSYLRKNRPNSSLQEFHSLKI